MSLTLGTLADYTAGAYPFTSNPVAPSPSGGPSSISESGGVKTVVGQFQEFVPDNCGCGNLCTAWIHEAFTDWWYPFFSADCAGWPCYQHLGPNNIIMENGCIQANVDAGCPITVPNTPLSNLCADCWAPLKTSFEQMAADAANDDFGPSTTTTLGNLFPGVWLRAFGYNPLQVADLDYFAISCDQATQTVSLTYEIITGRKPFTCPPGTVFDNATEQCITPHKAPVGALGFIDPPLPFAPDGPGFSAYRASWVPLPVHPALSDAAIVAACGNCGDARDAGDELEL